MLIYKPAIAEFLYLNKEVILREAIILKLSPRGLTAYGVFKKGIV